MSQSASDPSFIPAADDAHTTLHVDPTHSAQYRRSRFWLAIHCSVQTSDDRFNRGHLRDIFTSLSFKQTKVGTLGYMMALDGFI